ncbi:MAG TPA: hypothetical protein VNE63_20635 [Candidatus Acidoferrales bacterium]|nr:hypothetical protein [Candidatus Acidoferrales bacterium]
MKAVSKRMDVRIAAEDLRRRTLARIERPLDRLIYLASTRDYNTGSYYHEGLASRFTEEVASEAMADCHREAFRDLLSSSLENLVQQMEAYIDSTYTSPSAFIAAWRKLEPYRVAVPVETDLLSAEFLFSNLKIALVILEARLNIRPEAVPVAWPHQ